MTSFSDRFLSETIEIINAIDAGEIEKIAVGLARLRDAGGRLFILGVGGSAGHASHAVNDFRKICGFEAYAPTDNVSELTARVNDDGWETVFSKWLEGSRINGGDALLILSVGGGNAEKNVSINIIRAIDLAKSVGAAIYSIVGRDGGYAGKNSNAAAIIPPLFAERVTPHTEGLAAVVWHLLVSHPSLAKNTTKWESLKGVRP